MTSAARPGQRLRWAATLAEAAGLSLILLAASAVRLPSGGPGIYPDEGAHLAIAQNLLRGQSQFLAINQSVLLFSRLPLFEWLLAGALALAGAGPSGEVARGLLVLRTLTGGLGVLNTGLVYLVARPLAAGAEWHQARRWLPLLAAVVFIFYPAAAIAGRFGFSYHLLATLLLGAIAAAERYLATGARRWLALAAGLVGLGALTDVWGWGLIPLLLLVVVARLTAGRPWRAAWADRHAAGPHLALAAGLALLPLALFTAQQLLTAPAAFWFDLRFVLGRVSDRPAVGQLFLLAENLFTLTAQDGWLALSLVGLAVLRTPSLRASALLLGGAAFLLIARTAPLFSLGFYYLIPVLPLVPLGLAGLLSAVPGRVWPWLALALAALITLRMWFEVNQTLERNGYYFNPAAGVLVPLRSAQETAAYLATARQPGELVLASPGVAWLLPGEAADVQMALAYTGRSTPHVPADLPRDRYAYDPSFARAQYVVVDDLWRNWAAADVAGAGELLAEVETWPVVFSTGAGAVEVYQRPGTAP